MHGPCTAQTRVHSGESGVVEVGGGQQQRGGRGVPTPIRAAVRVPWGPRVRAWGGPARRLLLAAAIPVQHQRGSARHAPSPPPSPPPAVAAAAAAAIAAPVPLVCVPRSPSPLREAGPFPSPRPAPHPTPAPLPAVHPAASPAAAGPPPPPSQPTAATGAGPTTAETILPLGPMG